MQMIEFWPTHEIHDEPMPFWGGVLFLENSKSDWCRTEEMGLACHGRHRGNSVSHGVLYSDANCPHIMHHHHDSRCFGIVKMLPDGREEAISCNPLPDLPF